MNNALNSNQNKLLLIAIFIIPLLKATQIYFDQTFGPDGSIEQEINLNTAANAIKVQTDDKIVIAGHTNQDGTNEIMVARYSSSGVLDGTFGTNGIATTSLGSDDKAYTLCLQSDHKIVAAGSCFSSGQNNVFVTRYNTDGTLDTTNFGNPNGFVILPIGECAIAYASLIQPADQKIVVAGISTIQDVPTIFVARFNTDGSLDSSFGDNNSGITNIYIGLKVTAKAIAIQSDNKLVVTGFADFDTGQQLTVVRLNTDGSPDSNFGTNGIVTCQVPNSTQDNAYGLGLQSDQKIIVAGTSFINSIYRISLARFNTDGSIDTSFGTSGFTTTALAKTSKAVSLAIQSDDYIVVVGVVNNKCAIMRYTPAGTLDSTFGIEGSLITSIGTNSNFNAVDIQTDGKLLASGTSDDTALIARYHNNNLDFISIDTPANGSTISSSPELISGTSSQPNLSVKIFIDAIAIGTTTTDSNGKWSLVYPEISNGHHTITAHLISPTSPSTSLATDTISITMSQGYLIAITTPANNDVISSTVSQTATGTSTLASAPVQILIDGNLITTVTTDTLGNWQASYPPLAVGSHTMVAQLQAGSPLSTVASSTITYVSGTPVLFPTGSSQIRIIQANLPASGSGSGMGYTYTVSGSTITMNFTPAFVGTPSIIATGRRSSGSSTVTVASVSSSSTSISFSTGTQFVNVIATILS